jgi:hypothetical protein
MRDGRSNAACCIRFFVATSAVAYWNADTPKGCIVLESLSLALELEPAEHRDVKARLVKFGEIEVEGTRYTHDVVIDGGQGTETEKRTFQAIPRKVWPHAAFGRGRNPLGRQAAHRRNWRPWRSPGNGRSPGRGETARYRGHCGAHIGSLSPTRGREEGPGVRYPALHVLTRGFGRLNRSEFARPLTTEFWPPRRRQA